MKQNKIYQTLTSIRLTIVLLTAIAILCLLDTLVEDLHLIFSVPMYVLGALFAVNLTLCTIGRTEWAINQCKKQFRVFYFGSPLLHIGLIVVMLGAFLSWAVGRQTYYAIPVGETAQVAGRSGTLDLKIDDFRVEYYEDGVNPRQYVTDLTLTRRSGESVSLSAFVNGPARYDGITLIQQSYGWSFDVTIATPRTSGSFTFTDEEWIALSEDATGKVSLGLTFYPDYHPEEGVTEIRNMRDDNPRLLLVVTDHDVPVAMELLEKGSETQVTDDIRVRFDGYAYYTGLQAKYDPGVKIIFAGFFLVLAGLIIRYAYVMQQEAEKEKQRNRGET